MSLTEKTILHLAVLIYVLFAFTDHGISKGAPIIGIPLIMAYIVVVSFQLLDFIHAKKGV